MQRNLWIALALLGLVACEKKEEAAPSASSSEPAAVVTPSSTPASATQPVASASNIDLDSLPTEEDFEEEAEKEITAANLDKKLDDLEKEIRAE